MSRGARGELELDEEVARPVAVPYPFSLTLKGLELAFVMLEASARVSVSLSTHSLSCPGLSLASTLKG